jgi:hypothetical protein
MTGVEYRVRWRRVGRAGTSMIYQSAAGARGKIDRLLALEEVKGETDRFADMPDLAAAPILEVRPVGDWAPHPEPPAREPSEEALDGMSSWVNPRHEF